MVAHHNQNSFLAVKIKNVEIWNEHLIWSLSSLYLDLPQSKYFPLKPKAWLLAKINKAKIIETPNTKNRWV